MVRTAVWLINSDVGGSLVMAKDENGDTPAHDAADNGCVRHAISHSCALDFLYLKLLMKQVRMYRILPWHEGNYEPLFPVGKGK